MKWVGEFSDVAATTAKGAGTPRGMHAPPMVDACSRTARHPSSRAMTGIWNCGCMNAGGQGHSRRVRPSGTGAAAAVGREQNYSTARRRCSRHGRRPSSRERKDVGLGGCKNDGGQAVG